jgi:hypothetical protein
MYWNLPLLIADFESQQAQRARGQSYIDRRQTKFASVSSTLGKRTGDLSKPVQVKTTRSYLQRHPSCDGTPQTFCKIVVFG